MGYKTPEALEMAVTAVARASSMDTGRAAAASTSIACCVGCSAAQALPSSSKGGQSMLARTIGAQATRDIDILIGGVTLEQALAELKELASSIWAAT